MTARAMPTLPNPLSGQKDRASYLQALITFAQFWANPPMFRMRATTAQSVPNSTYTQVMCNTSDHDSDSGRSSLSPYSYTVPSGFTGIMQLGYMVGFAANNTGARFGVLYQNGSQIAATQIPLLGPSGMTTEIGYSDDIAVTAGDVLSLWCFQSSGAALNTDAGHCVFRGRLVSQANP